MLFLLSVTTKGGCVVDDLSPEADLIKPRLHPSAARGFPGHLLAFAWHRCPIGAFSFLPSAVVVVGEPVDRKSVV